MKYLITFFIGICVSALLKAQNPTYDVNKNVPVALAPQDKLKVNLSYDALTIVYKNREIPSASIPLLDSLMKVIPVKDRLNIEFNTLNSSDETVRTINTILDRCQCPIVRSRMVFPKQRR